ncbi:MAG: ABC transporter transmembrane domain-containing protein [Alphaproteobacteria bacterium]
MESSIFRYILRYSTPQQLYLVAVTVASYPFLFMSLELPKVIVNEAIDGKGPPFAMHLMGYEAEIQTSQIQFLLMLSFTYLFLVLMNGAFKYHINVFKGQLGERLLRRLRYQLYERMLHFPLPRFRKLGQGEIIPIITAEVEPLGGFIGTAYADPMFFGGQLVIILSFIVLQDPLLGLAAIAFYPLQIYLIPKLQRRVNRLAMQRIQNVRRLSDHLGESVSGIVELRANDTTAFELARFTQRLGRIYAIRFEIYRRKFFIKFLNNFIDKLTPFFFFSIGGFLVIHGDLTLGALIAVLAAYKDLAAPWKEMLVWYQQKEDAKVKYGQVTEQFSPPGMVLATPAGGESAAAARLDGETVVNVTLVDEDGVRRLDGASLTLPPASHAAIVGDAASGKSELAMLLARLQEPTHGKLVVGGHDFAALPPAVAGRRVGYVGANTHLNNASVIENLIYGLKRLLPALGDGRDGARRGPRAAALDEAARVGNSPFDYGADWIDYAAAGVDGPEALRRRLVDILKIVDLDGDVYAMGLRGCVDPDIHAETAAKILRARGAMRGRMQDPAVAGLVEPFDKMRYNGNATVGENLLFGAPLDSSFDMERLAEHPYVQSVLDRTGLTADFIEIGRKVAETTIELFADLPPDHEFFQQYSFIAAEDLPAYRQLVQQAARGTPLGHEDRQRLLSLPFMLITERHRLGLVGEAMQERILAARHAFAAGLPAGLKGAIAFFDEERYNGAATIQDNILFGKLAHGQAFAEQTIGGLIQDVVASLGLREMVIEVGLHAPVGIGGARLSFAQRQKVALGRALLKRPDMLVVNEAVEAFDAQSQRRVLHNVLAESRGRAVIWVTNRLVAGREFDQIVVMKDGKVAEQGSFDKLAGPGGNLSRLLDVA